MRSPGILGSLLLAATAACCDTVSYLGLGKVFPANMTGNTVLLSIGIVSGDYARVERSGVALAGFVVAAAATAMARSLVRLRHIALVEVALLAAASAWWISGTHHATGDRRLALIGLLGLAMGAQSAVVAELGSAVSTTFITGNWTAVSRAFGRWVRRGATPDEPQPRAWRRTAVLASYFASALIAGILNQATGPWAVLMAPVCLGAACVVIVDWRPD